MTDFRALCAELLSALESEGYAHWVNGPDEDALCLRARAALAQPEPEGPTLDDLSELCSEHGLDVDSWPLEKFEALWEVARAVLARWGNPAPQPPADGEVAELVAWLRMQGEAQIPSPNSPFGDKTKKELCANGARLTRAAELLQRQAPQPVPVSERPPRRGAEDQRALTRLKLLAIAAELEGNHTSEND